MPVTKSAPAAEIAPENQPRKLWRVFPSGGYPLCLLASSGRRSRCLACSAWEPAACAGASILWHSAVAAPGHLCFYYPRNWRNIRLVIVTSHLRPTARLVEAAAVVATSCLARRAYKAMAYRLVACVASARALAGAYVVEERPCVKLTRAFQPRAHRNIAAESWRNRPNIKPAGVEIRRRASMWRRPSRRK